ncbi:actin-like ATPase domain-containing protein [Pholiota conissans]|uniref:Phosphotransferase n=1 Tax=Pholiota conissans TaxID=109636 RepID=A0A9P5YRK8_9AGAR|nr:actin-like ATPase domain-containing protein [Pholiota conissans]
MANISAAARAVVNEVSAPFQLSDNQLVKLTNSMVGEFNTGLRQAGRPVAMVPTYVTHVPHGTEAGTFITIDFIWKDVRISEVTLDGGNKSSRRDKIFVTPKEVVVGTSAEFFDCIATFLDMFIKEFNIRLTPRTPVGLSFPFPVERMDLDKAKLVAWGKAINLQDGPGRNVQDLLQEAFDRKNINLKCGAITNDTVAVLLSESYGHPSDNCHIAAIFGVGTNGAYVEDVVKITKLGTQARPQMVVNTELGAFNNKDILPLTELDHSMEEDSRNPGIHIFEKLVSWIFLGELVRRILVSLGQKAPLVISEAITVGLQHPGSFNSRLLPLIDEAKTSEDVKKILADNFSLNAVNDQETEIFRLVSQLVSGRAIKLCACAVAALITQAGYTTSGRTDRIVVALAGELLVFFPHFKNHLRVALKAILGESVEKRVFFLVAQDAEAIGAALGVYEMERRD